MEKIARGTGSRFQELQAAKEKYQILFIISFLLLVVINIVWLIKRIFKKKESNRMSIKG